jgi:hypothetical protein
MKSKLALFGYLLLLALCANANLLLADDVPDEPAVKAAAKPKTKSESSSEPWKGPPAEENFTAGAMAGAGFSNVNAGFLVLGTAAIKIVNRGFADEIDDQVFVEAAAGPLVSGLGTDVVYSVHLRWDFQRDDNLSLYAVGGFGGVLVTQAIRGPSLIYPRFGLGLFYSIQGNLSLRAELSREWITAGVSFKF